MQEEFWQSMNSWRLAVAMKGAGLAGEGSIHGAECWRWQFSSYTLSYQRLPGPWWSSQGRAGDSKSWELKGVNAPNEWGHPGVLQGYFYSKVQNESPIPLRMRPFPFPSWLELVHSWTNIVVLVWINLPVAAQMLAVGPPLGFPFPIAASPSLGGCKDQILKVEAETLHLKAEGGSLCKNLD